MEEEMPNFADGSQEGFSVEGLKQLDQEVR